MLYPQQHLLSFLTFAISWVMFGCALVRIRRWLTLKWTCAGEIQTAGKGPLGQLGVPLTPVGKEYAGFALALWIGVFAVAAVGFNRVGQQEGNEEIY